MQTKTRKALKRIGAALLWLAVLTGFVVLLVAAVQDKDASKCTGIVVKLTGDDNNFFIEEKDIKALIAKDRAQNPVGMPISSINIANLEKIVSRDPWVQHAEIFIDNQRRLNIRVTQREPVARVFTAGGNTFYLDRQGDRIPVSARYAARVPVFTGFPSEAERLQKADSALAAGIIEMGRFILADPFWMAQVEQVVITEQREFEIIPKLGDHIIAFGDGVDVEKKFEKLLAFYKEGLSKVGWNNYSRINVAYENEVVCTRKNGVAAPSRQLTPTDSARMAGADEAPYENTVLPEPAHDGKPSAPATNTKAKERTATSRPAPARPKETKGSTARERQPKAVYKPLNRSVNTTKKHKTP